MLLINNQEVEKLFTMKDCLEALEDGYDDLLKGDALATGPTAITAGERWKAPAVRSACSPFA
ncbi:MAG: hypothetical protein HYU31_09070 [Deltaproteobacteria bacterium]|nr:hypothetical protein [Deltaproteobacteria bacterium]